MLFLSFKQINDRVINKVASIYTQQNVFISKVYKAFRKSIQLNNVTAIH